MKDVQYFSKLRGFLSGPRRRNTSRAGTRRTSRFRLESLEARVLLSADLGGALSVAEILNSPTIGAQQAVVQNVQPVQVAASTSSVIGTINIARATHENGNAYVVSQDFGTGRDTPSAATVSDLHIFENGRELGPAHSVHADIENLGNGRFSYWGGSAGTAMNLFFSASDNSNPLTNGRTYTYMVGSGSAVAPTPTPTQAPTPAPTSTPSQSTGQVYYVSPGGSDGNAGTASAPWRSIQAAAQHLQAGETAVLMDGTYEEGSIVFANSGTAVNPITIKAQNKWGAVLSSISGARPAISIDKSYITIEDLRISVSPNNSGSTTYSSKNASVRAWNTLDPSVSNPSTGTQGFTARGLLVDATSASRDTGIKTNQDFSVIENCVVHNEIETVNTNGTIIRNNTVYDGGPYGTYILGKGGTRNLEIYNNVVHMTRPGAGILLGGATGIQWAFDPSTGVEIYNSVAYNNVVLNETGDSSQGLFGIRGAQDSAFVNNVGVGGQLFLGLGGASNGNTNPVFQNNILVGTGGSATGGWDGYWSGSLTVDHNNFYNYGSAPSQAHPITGNPLLTADWHLQPGSPALGTAGWVSVAGFNSSSLDVTLNKDGVSRTIWNAGIY